MTSYLEMFNILMFPFLVFGGMIVGYGLFTITWCSLALRRHGKKPLDFHYAEISSQGISRKTFDAIYSHISECYHIDPRYISPYQKLLTFKRMDIWLLGRGTAKFAGWLETVSTAKGVKEPFQTVVELIQYVDTHPLSEPSDNREVGMALGNQSK